MLPNDSDVDGDTLTVSEVDSLPANVGVPHAGNFGTVVINSDGTYTYTLDETHPAVLALGPTDFVDGYFRLHDD